MAAGGLETVARLEGGLLGAETWSRDLLVIGLIASHGSMADRRYAIVGSEGSDGDGDAYDATDCAVGTGSHGSRLLGYAGLYHAGGPTSADLLIVATTPVAHGRGIASLMLTELVSTARGMSCPGILLEVCQSNETAQRLCTRHGFAPTDRRRRYYQMLPEDAVVVRLALCPHPGPVGAETDDPSRV